MSCRIFVGNLPIDIREREVDDLFYKYGRIRDIDLKTPSRPPAFAFVTFEDYRDAEDAIHGRDGYTFDGLRLRVEMSKGDRAKFGGNDRDRDRGGRYPDDRGLGKKTGGRRSEFGVSVTGLPKSCSWQDLKDYMRKAGDVIFADVDRNTGEGIVEFSNRDDMERAIDKLDDQEFKNSFGSAYIRVRAVGSSSSSSASGGSKRGGSRDRNERKRSPSRSRSRSRDKNDRKRSPSRSRSRSRSRSPVEKEDIKHRSDSRRDADNDADADEPRRRRDDDDDA